MHQQAINLLPLYGWYIKSANIMEKLNIPNISVLTKYAIQTDLTSLAKQTVVLSANRVFSH